MEEWYAVRSKPRKEATTALLLGQGGIEVYLPQVVTGGRREPFFPGYLFCRVEAASAALSRVHYTPGVVSVLGYGDEPSPVPEALIEALQRRLSGKREPGVRYQVGERVVITGGPLKGIEAVFAGHLSGNGRVAVLLELLKRTCRAEVLVSQVRRVGQGQAVGKVLSAVS